MHVSENDRLTALSKLIVPPEIERFLLDLNTSKELEYLFQKPYYFYSQGSPDNPGHWPALGNRQALPLWEHSEKVFAADLAKSPIEYIAFYIESPATVESLGYSIYRPLFHMLSLHVWEYGGGKKEASEAVAFAKTLHFPHLDQIEKLLNDPNATEQSVESLHSNL